MRARPSSLFLAGLTLFASLDAGAIGILVPTDPSAPVSLVTHRVDVRVTERAAVTHVTQEFENKTGRPLEATYLFPLPKDATVDEFALWMNGKRETGKVLEKHEARRIYESIVQRTRDPGLIEYVDAQLFQARVFPVPQSGRLKVELKYSHLVPYEGGLHRYVYPMKTDQHASSTLEDFTLSVAISSKVDVKNLYSPTHRVATRTRGKTANASFEEQAFSLADDFTLYWTVDDKEVGLTLLSYKEPSEPGYFLLLASPKDGVREHEIIGKRLTLVVDTSGSMAGEKMDAVKSALDYILGQLGGDDLFNIVTFGGYAEAFSERMQSASSANVQRAKNFVRDIEPLGGTNIDEALTLALGSATGNKAAPHIVVFLTDGRPTVGETDAKKLLAQVQAHNAERARVFVFGVGDDVNTLLLDKLAGEHGGTSSYLEANHKAAAELKSFYDRISHPVLADLALAVDGGRVYGAHPRRLPDLFKGGQLVYVGRYREPGKVSVTLAGATPRGKKSFTWSGELTASSVENSFLPRLWAQRQVAMLLEEIREKGESQGLIAEVTQLATAYGIVTPYTSYLVVEPGTVMPGPPPPRRDADLGAFAPAPAELESADDAPAPGASGGGGFGAQPKAESKARKLMKEEHGEGAVAAAREIGRLKDSTSVDERRAQTAQARALGRTFRFQGGAFVDERCGAKDKTLAVKPFSKAYFRVLELRPDLKQALALSSSVKVSVGAGRCLVVAPAGKEQLGDDELGSFLRR